MRRVAALVGHRIAAFGGGKAKTPHLNPLRGAKMWGRGDLYGARIGGQHWGLHPVVRGSIPRRSIPSMKRLSS